MTPFVKFMTKLPWGGLVQLTWSLAYTLFTPKIPVSFIPHFVNSFHSYKCNKWHVRLGHPSHRKLVELHKAFPFIDCVKNTDPCNVCHLSKQKKLPFPNSVSKFDKPFDLLHVDIWGPISTPSIQGHRYFLTIVDDAGRHTWLFFMKLRLCLEGWGRMVK